jgi:magnesium transporter
MTWIILQNYDLTICSLESLSEFQRIILLLKKSDKHMANSSTKINEEIDDLTVIADYLQYNFNRLDDLNGNINSKIELETIRF